MTIRAAHAPCEVTGRPCSWITCCEDCYEDYCEDCYQNRDWSLDVCPDDDVEKAISRIRQTHRGLIIALSK